MTNETNVAAPQPAADPADAAAKQAFTERVFGDLLGTMSIAGIYLGEALGLYDSLRDGGALTPGQLSERAGIDRRYAREWLEQQAANGVLTVDDAAAPADARRYALPPVHAAVLADRDDLDFLGWIGRGMVATFSRLPQVADAFRTGGGVPWSVFGDEMRTAQGDANRPLFLHALARDYLPAIPDVHARLQAGARVAEVGSGMGWAAIGMALAYPRVTVDGFDVDAPSVAQAARHAAAAGVADRVRFQTDNVATRAPEHVYDLVTAFECLHDMPHPVDVLRAMRAMIAPDGACIVMDERAAEAFAAPADDVDRFLYGFSLMVCLPDGMSHAASAATGTVMRPETLRRYAASAGFSRVGILDLEHPFFRFYRLHP